jgi:uncharacterized lipoprotein YddW (UPF0748 family)
MTLISGKIRLVVSVLLVFLVAAATVSAINSSSTNIASHGTISYQNIFLNARQSELRGVLVKYIYWYSHNDTVICQTLASYGFNAVYLEVSPTAWTGYALKDFQSMIDACKKYGLDFHALVVFGGYDPIYTDVSESYYPQFGLNGSDPDWRAVDVNGNYVNWTSFAKNSTRNRVKQVIQTMLTDFPDIVDLNLDYLRYPTTDVIDTPNINYMVDYSNESKAAFATWLQQNGKAPIGSVWPGPFAYGGARWSDFAEWRVIPINNMVRDVRQWALAINPHITISADVWTPWSSPGWTPDLNKEAIGQDPAYWISQGWLDSINPMNYVPDLASLQYRMSNESTHWLGGTAKGAIPLVPFITQGTPGNDVETPISNSTWLQQINYLRESGANGFIIWKYNGPGLNNPYPLATDIRPYLAAIQNSSAKGAYPVFKQTSPTVMGSTVIWQTSLPTTGKVEYSLTPMFTARPENGTLLPYVDIDYTPGTILSEPTPTQTHSITVPLSPPFYYRIRDNDTNVELASPVCLVTG